MGILCYDGLRVETIEQETNIIWLVITLLFSRGPVAVTH